MNRVASINKKLGEKDSETFFVLALNFANKICIHIKCFRVKIKKNLVAWIARSRCNTACVQNFTFQSFEKLIFIKKNGQALL